jgi:hypothetical protein
MANMLEGGGKTPILSPDALQGMGFKLVAYVSMIWEGDCLTRTPVATELWPGSQL